MVRVRKLLAAAGLVVAGAQAGSPTLADAVTHESSSGTTIIVAGRYSVLPPADTIPARTYSNVGKTAAETVERA
ncbi:hypothetical protein BJY24_005570 [Nocardia transvalensis]|uniref:Uncharacterized protein n=1 Tax=Nocardia transvalensis TaxID=37333 RepID=A0A7W9PJK1_9NOCA|nr:hypothetical protein [Nocardia transvalensis]